jgi:hypothetical protein
MSAMASEVPHAVVEYQRVATSGGAGKLADLFAEDAIFHDPRGGIQHGREAIRAFYDATLTGVEVVWDWGRVVVDGDHCWAELERDGRLLATDHFTLGPDGLITRMVVFLRPSST